jgi:hypothetical protein
MGKTKKVLKAAAVGAAALIAVRTWKQLHDPHSDFSKAYSEKVMAEQYAKHRLQFL